MPPIGNPQDILTTPYGYAGQMQQLPAPAKGNKFLREWWRFWSPTGKAVVLF